MGLLHLIPKLIASMACATAPIMLLYGVGALEDVPAQMIKANGGTGPDKGDWGADFFGVDRRNLLLGIGVCKLLALLDIWLIHLVPRLACVCVAIMMAAISYAHAAVGDDLPPPVVMGTMALITAATWPAAKTSLDKGKAM